MNPNIANLTPEQEALTLRLANENAARISRSEGSLVVNGDELAEDAAEIRQRRSPIVVLPVARFDWHLACRWLAWAKLITPEPITVVAICSPALTVANLEKLAESASGGKWDFGYHVSHNITELGYFGGTPNRCFLAALEYVEKNHPGHPMLWCEADTVPMFPGWYEAIRAEYEACGKQFLGDHHLAGPVPHMTGVAVYGPNWRQLSPMLANLPGPDPRIGWDSSCSRETLPQSARSTTIRQVWRPKPFTKENWRSIVPEGTALFHQCKDGTLIDVLSAEMGVTIPKEPQICVSTYEADVAEMTRCLHNGTYQPDGTMPVCMDRKLSVEIMIVTYAKDRGFLEYCLQSIEKYAKGFIGTVLVIPRHERKLFNDLPGGKVRIVEFDEVPGKGMMSAQIQKCRADQICPSADAILHMDSDCIAWKTFTPADYCPNSAPILVRETYEAVGARNPNRLFWRTAVEKALGFTPIWEGMTRHPQVHIREVYPMMRRLVEAHTEKNFDDYVISCKNDFPQSFAEWPTICAVAIRYFSGAYTMVEYDHALDGKECGVAPGTSYQYLYRRDRDKIVEFWSHGGIKPVEKWCQNFVAGQLPVYHMK